MAVYGMKLTNPDEAMRLELEISAMILLWSLV